MVTHQYSDRIVEAFVGEYASGKSEMAINRAIELRKLGHKVTLVDLDTVEPFYTLRPLKELLEEQDLHIISFSTKESFGLGETGAMLNPRARWALMNEGDIILDIGYGVYGAKTLNLVEGAEESLELKVMAVFNYSRPMTNSLDKIIEYIKDLGRVDAIVANTHLGNETTLDIIIKGNNEIIKAGQELNIPIAYIAIDKVLYDEAKDYNFALPVKYIERYMPNAMW
ncbi:MAG: hypothetical protein GX333_04945 [Syntrophomonadaceae bacterium]|nr:hypothetical protein [Syntrophomonadaceae bacterium]